MGIISWSNTKFSELTIRIVDSKENYKFDLGVKGLKCFGDLSPSLFLRRWLVGDEILGVFETKSSLNIVNVI